VGKAVGKAVGTFVGAGAGTPVGGTHKGYFLNGEIPSIALQSVSY
jgi:hypothetical protein